MDWLRTARSRQVIAAVLVTAVTAILIGVILIAATPLGCGPANVFGLKSISSKCYRPLAVASPSPLATQSASASPSPSPSPTPVSSPSPLPSATTPDTGPATAAYPPFYPGATGSNGVITPARTLNCRLPVFAGPPGSGGFIVFPGGSFIADPASAVSLPSPAPGEPSPLPTQQAGQGGPGYGQPTGLSYDAPYRKWVPVGLNQVSPDGSKYVFLSASSIYVEDVASGTLSQTGSGQAWTIVGVQAAGVYAMQPGKAGLWLVPYTGAPRQITSVGFWQAASSTGAFGTVTSAVPAGASNEIIRVDLNTGALATWFSRKNSQSAVMGIDAVGAPIISVSYHAQNYYANEVWIVPSAGHGIPIGGSSQNYDGVNLGGPPVADQNGVWFPANLRYAGQGFALYVPGSGVYWMTNLSATLAGGCVKP